jgi:protein-tyrosine phosphatase
MIDLHCHVLPDVDDGARDMEESLAMLRKASTSGVEIVVATPHLLLGAYGIGFSERKQLTADLQKAADNSEIEIRVKPGVEYYLSPELLEDTSKLRELTINNNGKYLLVELPMQTIPAYTDDVFFKLNVEGITPVLAHPERNVEICQNPNILFDFTMKGVVAQLNAGSLLGYFGRQSRKAAQILLTHRLVQVIASDMHSANSPALGDAIPEVKELVGSERVSQLFVENPHRVLDGETLSTEPPQRFASDRRGLKAIFSRSRFS